MIVFFQGYHLCNLVIYKKFNVCYVVIYFGFVHIKFLKISIAKNILQEKKQRCVELTLIKKCALANLILFVPKCILQQDKALRPVS